jgi:uncharacterized membrane protein SirB2
VFASHYGEIRFLHIGCVALSGGLFTIRGLLRIGDVPAANHSVLPFTSYVIDTALLSAAIALALILHRFPFTDAWLARPSLRTPES